MTSNEHPSIFFSSLSEAEPVTPLHQEIIYSSNQGYSVLYRYNKDGKFRILKGLKPSFIGNPIYERLLKKEYEIGYELEHPNICKIYSFSNIKGIGNAIEMEYIDGSTLDDTITYSNISKKAVEKILCQICDALTYIHNKQIIHRDLKPQNILITHNGQNVKLIDFGLSDSDWYSILKTKAGTKKYAAPELLEKGEIDNRTDIYSLGKIIESFGFSYKTIASKCTREAQSERYACADEVKSAILQKRNNTRTYLFAISFLICISFAIIATFLLTSKDTDNTIKTIDEIFKGIEQKIIQHEQ